MKLFSLFVVFSVACGGVVVDSDDGMCVTPSGAAPCLYVFDGTTTDGVMSSCSPTNACARGRGCIVETAGRFEDGVCR